MFLCLKRHEISPFNSTIRRDLIFLLFEGCIFTKVTWRSFGFPELWFDFPTFAVMKIHTMRRIVTKQINFIFSSLDTKTCQMCFSSTVGYVIIVQVPLFSIISPCLELPSVKHLLFCFRVTNSKLKIKEFHFVLLTS